ncbi:hypothetical protein [uncultured Gemella sp.]|uniref:hypothetical protein n=1 Tax=uncultured Gemella sp. TaxID=254352 RepID=UPI0028D380DB|nr:hypothetical protein [uncultured Gemella sp.]
MGKKIRKFPSIKKNNNFALDREIELVYTELQENTFKNIKFINKEDQLDFNESLKLFANFMVTGDKKFIEKAHLKSPYNIFANIFMLSEQQKSPLEIIEDIDELKFKTVKYPIVGNPNFKNDFNKVVIQHLISIYLDNQMYSAIPNASLIWINLEKGELKLDGILMDTIIAYLKIDSADRFYRLYNELSPASKLDEFVQLAKIIFDIRRLDDEEVVETMATLKYINPKIERLLDIVSSGKLFNENEFTRLIHSETRVEQLIEFIMVDYVIEYLMWVNSRIRTGKQLNEKIKVRNMSVETMRTDSIFENLSTQVLKALKKEGLLTKKDFLNVTEKYLLNEVDNVGKKSIKQLKENGVEFKKEVRS